MPVVGSKVRVTRTHESGAVVSIVAVVELVHVEDIDGPEACVVFVDNTHVRLRNRRGWTVTWEELEPPKPELPEEPTEDGTAFLDRSMMDVWVRDGTAGGGGKNWWRSGDRDACDWASVNSISPQMERLVPASEVVDADLARRLVHALQLMLSVADDRNLPLPSTMHQAKTALAEARAQIGGAS